MGWWGGWGWWVRVRVGLTFFSCYTNWLTKWADIESPATQITLTCAVYILVKCRPYSSSIRKSTACSEFLQERQKQTTIIISIKQQSNTVLEGTVCLCTHLAEYCSVLVQTFSSLVFFKLQISGRSLLEFASLILPPPSPTAIEKDLKGGKRDVMSFGEPCPQGAINLWPSWDLMRLYWISFAGQWKRKGLYQWRSRDRLESKALPWGILR